MTVPTKDQIHKFLADLGSSLTKRELIDAFHIKGDERVPFKRALREMEDEGLLIKEGSKSFRVPDALPAVTVIEVDSEPTAALLETLRTTPGILRVLTVEL